MRNLKSKSVLKKMSAETRVSIINFLIQSESFGQSQSIELLSLSYPKIAIYNICILVNEFWTRNPQKVNNIYLHLIEQDERNGVF